MNIDQLFYRHFKSITARINRHAQDAEMTKDIIQNAFVKVLQHKSRRDFPQMENEAGYFYRVASNELASFKRSKKNFIAWTPTDEDPDLIEEASSPELLCQQRQQLEIIQAAVANMPDRTRRVFQLCRLEDKTYPEVAHELNISISSVQKHLRKALDTLIDALE